MEPSERHFLGLSPAGFHRNAYWEWSAPVSDAPTLIAAHGLIRNGRDFDPIARALSSDRRVICPDVVGRGKSAWLADGALYGYPQYLSDANAMIARLDADAVDWLGTSMGGLIGMMLAAQPGAPIRRLILNDVGAFIPAAVLRRLGSYVGENARFDSLAALEAYLRRIYESFGPLSDAHWGHLAWHSARALADGGFALAYDPAIASAFAGQLTDIDLWSVWDQIACPVLIIRGGHSDLLLAETATEMVRRKPGTELVTFDECGHAPALVDPRQIEIVREWLDGTRSQDG